MNILERLGAAGIVPVVVIDDVKDAVPTAQAMLKGGVDVMEITLRTPAGLGAIEAVAASCPDMVVGAGTVITLEQGKAAVAAGAKFLVSPGFDRDLVKWCVENDVNITPGCVTPTEITEAMKYGLKVLKFFPANVYGGLSAMKALSGPFGGVKFIPTGGVNAQNLGEYISAPFVHAVGGSWVCAKADIAAGNFDKITTLCAEARKAVLGYSFAHLGINMESQEASLSLADKLAGAFGFATKQGASSNFSNAEIEIMNSMYLGDNGHIAIRTNSIPRALADLEKKGLKADMETAKSKNGKMIAVYLEGDFGGFRVHLLQK